MLYKGFEIDISKCTYLEGCVSIPLSTGEIVCIPEQDATLEEIELINAIKVDVESREIKKSESVIAGPTIEDRINALENAMLTML